MHQSEGHSNFKVLRKRNENNFSNPNVQVAERERHSNYKADYGWHFRGGEQNLVLVFKRSRFFPSSLVIPLLVLNSLRNASPKSCKNTEVYSKYSPFTPDKILTPKEIIYSL